MLKNLSLLEKLAVAYFSVFTLIGFVWSYVDHDSFKRYYVVEDGFTEWSTVVVLLIGFFVCFRRVWLLKNQRPLSFLFMTSLLGLFFFFGAGEEISWGQRIFDIESSEFFTQNNAQGETNLHNLVVNDTKLNKVIFGRGIGILLLLYLAVLIPLYKRKEGVKLFLDKYAVPIAQNYQIVAYIALLLLIQVLMASSKKGEMLEFAGSVIFLLNVVYPYNKANFTAQVKE
ncbi:MAG: hypothetical protein KZQ64_09505 [gamma proteobacterium symbiont of Bathyaustriella thionipta]|nr:hypothetical protein [gamma proteobacterium symbiont of Bathyaustriella thionipta]MCU7949405.1 hypothetical protein [gamma proteobacterium symbiont of Bathyaustriella thionipta]MCU7953610.1 hypothetical protein [gamma proteobacterium symbiont of Bathyaustriella thionipta]MCU7956259.1 hypothetical protein [gamma proteobacterium symbiont of Bathyaustriella thionipta]MCU7965985.1 hypothetical protein [gamma proteobacterium symbiont of Bathyaustriella thionipta]